MKEIKADDLLRIMEELPVSSEEERIILRGLGGAAGAKPGILVLGGPTGDPLSLLPVKVPVFPENDAPRFPVKAVFGDKFYIRLYQGNLVREFARAEDFREASYEGAERCVIACPFEPLRETELRFCYLDPDPAHGYTGDDFARIAEGVSGCVFVLGAGDGALMNKMDDFCAWAAGRGMFAGNAALILNHAERDTVNPFLKTSLKKSLQGELAAVLTATPFPEYADEDFEILPKEEALRLAISAVSAAGGGKNADETLERCRASLIEKVREERCRLREEEEQLQSRIRIYEKIQQVFPSFVRTMFPSENAVFSGKMKQEIYEDLHRFLQRLHDSIPEALDKCAEESPDTYRNDLGCFADDYLADVLNGGIRAMIGDVTGFISKSLEEKLKKIRSDFSLYIHDAPEFAALAEDKADLLNCANVELNNFVPPIAEAIAKLPGILAGALANKLIPGSGSIISNLVNGLLGGAVKTAVTNNMPRSMFIGHVKKMLQDQILDSMNSLDEMLNQYVYPMLTGYIMSSRDGLIDAYCESVKSEEDTSLKEAAEKNETLRCLEEGLRKLDAVC